MSLRTFIDDADAPQYTIAVVGDERGPLADLLAETFGDGQFAVESVDSLPDESALDPEIAATLEGDGDAAVLLEDDVPVAASPMAALYDSLLAINSDLFVTGARGLGEIELPDLLAGLEDTRLQLRGYPLAHKEKLLLILVSRYIERRAWEAGDGTLRTAFQRLSRIEDEVGTREVYERLAETDVDVHVYGEADAPRIDRDLDVAAHTGARYRDVWFVVFDPADPSGGELSGALVCLETEPRVWEGFWTTDPDRVAEIEAAIERER